MKHNAILLDSYVSPVSIEQMVSWPLLEGGYKQKRARGFTLIEVLVVIAVIGILAALTFPVFIKAREKARQTTCLSNLRQLGIAMRMYADDWDGRFPTVRIFEGGEGNPYGNWAGCYIYGGVCDLSKGQIYSYVKNAGVFLCPSARGTDPDRIRIPGALPYPLSYSMNALLSYRNADAFVAPTSRVGLLIHEATSTIDDGDFNWMGGVGNPNEGTNMPAEVHNGGTCIIYCDMHTKWLALRAVIEELVNNDWNPDKP